MEHRISRCTQHRVVMQRPGAYTTTRILFCNVIRHGLYTRVSFRLATLFHRSPPPSPSPSLSLSPPPSSPPPLSSSPRFLVIYPGAPASGLSAISARSRPVIINAANYSANSLAYLVSPWAPYCRCSSRAALAFLLLVRRMNLQPSRKRERERERNREREKRKKLREDDRP